MTFGTTIKCGLATVAVVLALAGPPARAEEAKTGCDAFEWPIDQELSWFSAAGMRKVASGEAVEPGGAFELALSKLDAAKLSLPPEKAPKEDAPFAGLVTIAEIREPGVYQVTLSDRGWIDMIKDGKYVPSAGNTMGRDCKGARKSVRFNLAAGTHTLQVSGVPAGTILVALRKAP
jgi:hypothetical protein